MGCFGWCLLALRCCFRGGYLLRRFVCFGCSFGGLSWVVFGFVELAVVVWTLRLAVCWRNITS